MQTYDQRIKATHQRAGSATWLRWRRTPCPPPEAPGGFTPVVAVAFKPTFTPALNDTDRVAVFTMADPSDGGRLTVLAAPRSSPAQQSVTLDCKGRLRLGPSAVTVLNADPGAQVPAITVSATGGLVLLPAAAALAQLTGPLATTAPAPSREHQFETGAPSRTRPCNRSGCAAMTREL